jgi:2-polyprenyl-6-methoxyphenol hydroxylase-like FAD-dependent oxidoreductase
MSGDVIIIGGGLGGSALGRALAEAGMKATVLEKETAFRDRVRGEQMLCWGVAEARTLGILDGLRAGCGHEVRYWSTRFAGAPEAPPRDLVETTPAGAPALDFHHPRMQEVMIGMAEEAGASVLRGVTVLGLVHGDHPCVRIRRPDGREETLSAGLVVGADGRRSNVRRWAGFATETDPPRTVIAGVLLDGVSAPEDRVSLHFDPEHGRAALAAPIGGGRFRCYLVWFPDEGAGDRGYLSGTRDLPAFLAGAIGAGMPRDWFDGAEAVGPLASFEGAEHWVAHPYREGVVLVGDAAGASDPSFGCGLSLTLRDVRTLRDALCGGAAAGRDQACHAYAESHDGYYGAVRRITGWLRTLACDPRPEAAAIRARALPRLAAEPDRALDIVGVGPDGPSDEAARKRFHGEA